jgi:hypothetical protein
MPATSVDNNGQRLTLGVTVEPAEIDRDALPVRGPEVRTEARARTLWS